MYEIVPIEKLVPAEDNLRRKTGDVRDLAASIAAVGLVEPLLVAPREDGGYTVVAGHRRLAAAVAAGLAEVPCTVRWLTDVERVEIMLIENLQRSDLSPIEEASGLFRLVEFGLSQKELARRIGRSPKHVAARLALLQLPPQVQEAIDAGSVTVGEATALLGLKDHPDVIERLLADEWERRDLERSVVRELTRIEDEAKAAATRAALAADGVPVIEEWSRYERKGPAELGNGHGTVPVTLPVHKREPCHAAHVTRSGEVVHLCTDPRRHRVGGGSRVVVMDEMADARAAERAAKREVTRAWNAATKERTAFAASLVSRRLPGGDVGALVASQFLAAANTAQVGAVCDLLAIEVPAGPYPDHRRAVEGYAARSTANRNRAALALALVIGEEAVRSGAGRGAHPAARRHHAFLAAYGYRPSEVEGATTAEADAPSGAAPEAPSEPATGEQPAPSAKEQPTPTQKGDDAPVGVSA